MEEELPSLLNASIEAARREMDVIGRRFRQRLKVLQKQCGFGSIYCITINEINDFVDDAVTRQKQSSDIESSVDLIVQR